tara:strand:+ start:478 stop:1089 length:612 start_codon:yes stop_codon:yes gene_type:complete
MKVVHKTPTITKTKSYYYLLPFLGKPRSFFGPDDADYQVQLCNVYLADELLPGEQGIFLLMRYDDKLYKDLDKAFKEIDCFRKSYEPDKYHTMYVYDIPASHKQSYDYYLAGQYSKFFKEHKEQNFEFHKSPRTTVNNNLHLNFSYRLKYVFDRDELGYIYYDKVYGLKVPRDQEVEGIVSLDKNTYKKEYRLRDALELSKQE